MTKYQFTCGTTNCGEHTEVTAANKTLALRQLKPLGWGASPVRLSCPGHEARVRLMYRR